MPSLIKQLQVCLHLNISLPGDHFSDLVVCFNCGSTKRSHENNWVKPWIWRKNDS